MATFREATEAIKQIFRDEYLIPEYQRPYSWGKDECQQLVDDVEAFHNTSDDSNAWYFLGSIVITHTETEPDRWIVIDGQQRLTTLLLLIKALEKQCGGYHALRALYEKSDPKTGAFNSDFRLKYEIAKDRENLEAAEIARDRENLEAVLRGETPDDPDNNFSRNFEYMDAWLKGRFGTIAALEEFRKTLLEHVFLLPIRGYREVDALTIFITMNDRGKALTDADIFKVILYKNVPDSEKKRFVSDWARLLDTSGKYDDYGIDQIFRIYWHVLRAQGRDIGREGSLRAYFRKEGRLDNPQEVMDCLKKYKAVANRWDGITPECSIWWRILWDLPHKYWIYPLYVFLHKHATFEEGKLALSPQKEAEFIKLIKATVRYLVIMGVATHNVRTVQTTIYRACRDIAHDGDYDADYRASSSRQKATFEENLKNCDWRDYEKVLVLISSALHSSQRDKGNREKYKEFLDAGYEIEHIVPRNGNYKWNNYDGWTEEKLSGGDICKLGNLIPLEESLNRAASNEIFARKQKQYKKSKNPEARCLGEGEYGDSWSPETLEKRNKDVLKRLKKFFCSMTIKEIFRDEYLIQRPYSWDDNKCQQLVDDLLDFHKEKDKSDEPCFLGCLVVTHGETGQGPWIVIDGQQRLTTILLLIKALHESSGLRILRECYEKTDPETGEFTDEFRLKSGVEGDRENLEDVFRLGSENTAENRFSKEFKHMLELLVDNDRLEEFIMTLLDRVVFCRFNAKR